MTIDEAIKFKEEYRREHYYGYDPKFVEADDLSIEALKREIKHRQIAKSNHIWLLPGETKD